MYLSFQSAVLSRYQTLPFFKVPGFGHVMIAHVVPMVYLYEPFHVLTRDN